MVEVGWKAGWGAVNELVIVGDILPEAGEYDSEVGDGVLAVARLEVHLQAGLVQLVLPAGRGEAAQDEVVRHPGLLRQVGHPAAQLSYRQRSIVCHRSLLTSVAQQRRTCEARRLLCCYVVVSASVSPVCRLCLLAADC